MSRGKPRLTFLCELDSGPLQNLFAKDSLIEDLKALDATISVGIKDLSPQRAAVIRALNAAQIPLVAWLLLPDELGYWFNAGNIEHAVHRYNEFQKWTQVNNLQWQGVGLDIEPDIRNTAAVAEGPLNFVPRVLRMIADSRRLYLAQHGYQSLVARMRSDGYRVDAYYFPFILDARAVRSNFFLRFLGLVDINADRDVLMLYSSFLRPLGHGVLWSYAPEAQSIAVGSTGGGVSVGGFDQIPALKWGELSRDLRLAYRWSDDIHIFSLEGCVKQGFLKHLHTLDWDELPPLPLAETRQVERWRLALRGLLWSWENPGVVLGAFAGFLSLALLLRRRLKV